MKQEQSLGDSYIAPMSKNSLPGYSNMLQLLEHLPMAVYITDGSGVIIYSNKLITELWGRKPGPGERAKDLWNDHTFYNVQGSVLDFTEVSLNTGLINTLPEEELCIENSNGLSKNIIISRLLLKDTDKGNIFVFYLNDITSQKQVQKQLERKTLELQDYVDNAVIGLHWVDGNGIILWANKAEMDMLGYTAEEYIGHHISEFHADRRRSAIYFQSWDVMKHLRDTKLTFAVRMVPLRQFILVQMFSVNREYLCIPGALL